MDTLILEVEKNFSNMQKTIMFRLFRSSDKRSVILALPWEYELGILEGFQALDAQVPR